MAESPRILFVDDEPNILGAMRRMTRLQKGSWTIICAQSGEAALKCLGESPADVVISDMMMPGMDGGQLLEIVKERYPGIIRIALSGQVGLAQVMGNLKCVHQYISKPCSAEDLVDKIETALLARDRIPSRRIREWVSNADLMPVQSHVHEGLLREFDKPEPSLDVVVDLITHDISLTAKMLSLVNSPFFALPKKIESIHEALSLLGLDVIKRVVLSTQLFMPLAGLGVPNMSLRLLNDHSRRVTDIVRRLVGHAGAPRSVGTRAAVAGLMHDIGKTILATACGDQFSEVLALVEREGVSVSGAEKKVLGTTHAEMGAYFLALLGLEREVVHAVGAHHGWSSFDMSEAMFLHVADVLDHNCVSVTKRQARQSFNAGVLESGGSRDTLTSWTEMIRANWETKTYGVPFEPERILGALREGL